MKDMAEQIYDELNAQVVRMLDHARKQTDKIVELETELAKLRAAAPSEGVAEPVAYMFDVQVKRLGQRRQFAAIDYNLDSDEVLVSKTPLYTALQPAEADKLREALQALETEKAVQEQHYGKMAACAAAGSKLHRGEADCTEGVILGVEYCINRLKEIIAQTSSTGAAVAVQAAGKQDNGKESK